MKKMIIKRDGSVEEFNKDKIFKALKKAFISTNRTFKDEEIMSLVDELVVKTNGDSLSVEEIQNLVEALLMDNKYYDVARNYIIYREERTKMRQYRYEICRLTPSYDLYKTLKEIQKEYNDPQYSLEKLLNKFKSNLIFKMTEEEKLHNLIHCAIDLTTTDAPKWDYISARLFLVNFNKEIKDNLKTYNLTDFYDRINLYVNKYHYDKSLLLNYTKEEVYELEKIINKNRSKLLNFSKINYLLRYIVRINEVDYIMSIQEFYLLLAMMISSKEENKIEEVTSYYNLLSKQEINLENSRVNVILRNLK